MVNKKLIVMDYSVMEVHIFDYNRKEESDKQVEEVLNDHHTELGTSFELRSIDYMIIDMKDKAGSVPLHIH